MVHFKLRFALFKKVYRNFKFLFIFAPQQMVVVAQLVRASDCDSEGRGFEPHHPPQ